MEGKEVRLALPIPPSSPLLPPTPAARAAVNSMHDSFTPLGGMVPMVNIHAERNLSSGRGRWTVWNSDITSFWPSLSPD